MNTKLLYSLFLLLTAATLAHAQGTAFTYQGRLNLDGAPVNGPYDFRFSIYTAGAGGSLVWSVNVNNAYYTAGNVGIGLDNPQERLTIAGVPNYNNGLKLTGNLAGGTGMALENTSSGGHKYSFFSAGSGNAVGA